VKRFLAFTVLMLCAISLTMAQGSAGTGGPFEPRYLVDVPTAGMLPRGALALDMDFYEQGGILLGVSVGVLDRLSLGISYGGSGLIGSEVPLMNPLPGVNIKVRLIEESVPLPALALGFDSQGKDGYVKDLKRYVVKSPGLYAVASKNYSLLGFISFHGGVNYSFERADGDHDMDGFFGIEKTVGGAISLSAEYDLGANDSNARALGRGHGYINAGISWTVGNGLTLGVCFKDLSRNGNNDLTVANRTVKLEYARNF